MDALVRTATRSLTLAVVSMLVAMLAACTSGASPSTGTIRAEDPWARPSMGMERAGAVYMVLVNESGAADALVSATSSAAAKVELHETTAGSGGMMEMHPVDRIDLPAGEQVALEPGGLHVMLIDLTEELTVGDTVELTLTFEHAAPITISAPVREG
jgi:copper(I)-binding protein